MQNVLRVIFQNLPCQSISSRKQKDALQSVVVACIGSAVGCDCAFSKLGKLITKAETACFASESSCPLSNGIENSDTGSLTEFFEAIEDVSCDTSWDAPVDSKETVLSSCVLDVDREKDLSKRTTLMIMIPLNRMRVQRFLETTCERMKTPGSLLPLLGL
jgi:hypothetical protein